ncbi:UNVERIFIED_CONTAM: hypothetical protein Slati_0315600 [Sesamum latifolium]|uniref:Ubiquitin-like domain-containing protein n=1 Tax=Sesamum latifolium TaxID=2727402 RepID=A0AAW2YF74_9LAMI
MKPCLQTGKDGYGNVRILPGKLLEDGRTLANYISYEDFTLHIAPPLASCPWDINHGCHIGKGFEFVGPRVWWSLLIFRYTRKDATSVSASEKSSSGFIIVFYSWKTTHCRDGDEKNIVFLWGNQGFEFVGPRVLSIPSNFQVKLEVCIEPSTFCTLKQLEDKSNVRILPGKLLEDGRTLVNYISYEDFTLHIAPPVASCLKQLEDKSTHCRDGDEKNTVFLRGNQGFEFVGPRVLSMPSNFQVKLEVYIEPSTFCTLKQLEDKRNNDKDVDPKESELRKLMNLSSGII